MVLNSHYRKQLTFSFDSLKGAETAYKKLKNKVLSLKETDEIDSEIFETYKNKFKECISDDLNTANAITLIYDVLKIDTTDKTKKELIKYYDQVLSLDLTINKEKEIDEVYIKNMIEKRNEAKKNKDFLEADKIREELFTKGIILKDTREGTTYEVN